MTKHTPTPWKLETFDNGDDAIVSIPANEIILWTYSNKKYCRPMCERDAQHIVKCVNSHDILVNVAKAFVSTLEILEEIGHKSDQQMRVKEWAKEALEKVNAKT